MPAAKYLLLLMLPLLASAQKRNAYLIVQSNPECRYCIKEIQDAFASVKGVRSIEVDTLKRTVRFFYHAARTNEDSLKKKLNLLGYSVDGVPGAGKKSNSVHRPTP